MNRRSIIIVVAISICSCAVNIAPSNSYEGFCLVEYTVTKEGNVKDVVVLDAHPKGVFEKASIESALQFEHEPRLVDGMPVEVKGVQNRFKYYLDSEHL